MPRILALLVCFFSSVSAQNADWRFIHPNAKVFVGVKLGRVLQSPIAREVRAEMQGPNVPDLSAGLPGADLFRQIDELFISSPGPAPGAAPDAQPAVLIRATGRFDAARMEEFFRQSGARMQTYLKHRVFRHRRDGDMAATLVDAHTVLIGDAPSLFAALERMDWSADATPRNPLLARAVELDATCDIWAVFDVPPSSFSQVPQLPALDSVQGMELAMNVNDGIALRLGLSTDSPTSAEKLASTLKQLLFLAMKTQAPSRDTAELANKLRFNVDNATVRLELSVGPQQIRKALAEARRQIEQRAQIAAIQRPTAPASAARPEPPPQPRVIRIEGLDDGPREIPYK